MRSSSTLIAFIKKMESCQLSAYKDVAGVWTIGYGHTKGVKPGDRITQFQAEQFLKDDLATFEAIASRVRNVATQGRFDAVVDFLYNCGPGHFNSSTLKKYIEGARKTWEIQEQFLRWVNSGGKKQGGLVSRRIWEAARFAE
jgi:lysozyme